MQAIALFAIATASLVAAQDTCTTSKGGIIQITTPYQGQSISTGANFDIVWNLQSSTDDTFNAAQITFGVVDASNPNNAPKIGAVTLAGTVTPKSGKTSGTIPASIPVAKSYAIRSEYLDTDSKWRYCFSPSFTVAAAAAPVTTAAGNATVSPSPAAPAPTSKSSASALVAGAFSIVAALVL